MQEDDLLRDAVEARLLEVVRFARVRFENGQCAPEEYEDALRHFNDFIAKGTWPNKLGLFGENRSARHFSLAG